MDGRAGRREDSKILHSRGGRLRTKPVLGTREGQGWVGRGMVGCCGSYRKTTSGSNPADPSGQASLFRVAGRLGERRQVVLKGTKPYGKDFFFIQNVFSFPSLLSTPAKQLPTSLFTGMKPGRLLREAGLHSLPFLSG